MVLLCFVRRWKHEKYKTAKYSFIGVCDRVRKNEENDLKWHEMMKNASPVTMEEFLSQCDMSDVLDEGETVENYLNIHTDIEFFKSNFGVSDCYFFKTAGFEFIWV